MKIGEVKGVVATRHTHRRAREEMPEDRTARRLARDIPLPNDGVMLSGDPIPSDRRALSESPAAPLASDARSTVMRLMAEVDQLKSELELARARMRTLEAQADEDCFLPVLNRRGFMRELARALAHAERYGSRLSLIYLDLNGFKRINDAHGHRAGDIVLQGVAATLVGSVRVSDIVGRLGGDEFAAILWSADGAAAEQKARALETAIAARRHDIGAGAPLAVTIAAGAVELAADETAEAALMRADRAMYARKAAQKSDIRQ